MRELNPTLTSLHDACDKVGWLNLTNTDIYKQDNFVFQTKIEIFVGCGTDPYNLVLRQEFESCLSDPQSDVLTVNTTSQVKILGWEGWTRTTNLQIQSLSFYH